MAKKMRRVKVIAGDYKNREGMADFSNTPKTGNVMFYPKEGIHPYRVCIGAEEVQLIAE